MAIPGLKPKVEIRAKVRIGEKRVSAKGRDYPASVDYFQSDDPELAQLFGNKPKLLRIIPAYADPTEFFSSGMEWWIQDKNKKSMLACYTKGDGTALRMEGMKDPENEVLGPVRGNQKLPIVCAFRECRQFKAKNCKPMARLTFYLEGGRMDTAYQLDTKSWNSIEQIEGALGTYPSVRGKVFELRVEMQQQGDKKFPTLTLQEADVQINTEADIDKADALIALAKACENGDARGGLAAYLDATMPGWRDRTDVVERIVEIGPEAAAEAIFKRERVA